jgi:hypothetical protein
MVRPSWAASLTLPHGSLGSTSRFDHSEPWLKLLRGEYRLPDVPCAVNPILLLLFYCSVWLFERGALSATGMRGASHEGKVMLKQSWRSETMPAVGLVTCSPRALQGKATEASVISRSTPLLLITADSRAWRESTHRAPTAAGVRSCKTLCERTAL